MSKTVSAELITGLFKEKLEIDVNGLKQTYIAPRPIVCKECNLKFQSIDVMCFDYNDDRVLVHCPQCKTQNLILKRKMMS